MSEVFPLSAGPLARWGRSWFRWRSFSPVPFFLLMIILPPEFSWEGQGWIFPFAGILLAEAVRVWAVGFAGSVTRTRGDSVPELVHAGPYRWVRNPLYLANIALYSLTAVLFGFILLAVIVFLYSCVQYILIVRYEEVLLKQTFGLPYYNYQSHVPRWTPFAQAAYEPSRHQFHLKRALRSERGTFISIAAVLVALFLKNILT